MASETNCLANEDFDQSFNVDQTFMLRLALNDRLFLAKLEGLNLAQDLQGLSAEQASVLLKKYGPNSLPDQESKGLLTTLVSLLSEPMILLLLACTTIYLVIGEFAEGLFLGASIGVVIAISFAQQRKAERALDALRTLSSPRALVIRDGKQVRIAGQTD